MNSNYTHKTRFNYMYLWHCIIQFPYHHPCQYFNMDNLEVLQQHHFHMNRQNAILPWRSYFCWRSYLLFCVCDVVGWLLSNQRVFSWNIKWKMQSSWLVMNIIKLKTLGVSITLAVLLNFGGSFSIGQRQSTNSEKRFNREKGLLRCFNLKRNSQNTLKNYLLRLKSTT